MEAQHNEKTRSTMYCERCHAVSPLMHRSMLDNTWVCRDCAMKDDELLTAWEAAADTPGDFRQGPEL